MHDKMRDSVSNIAYHQRRNGKERGNSDTKNRHNYDISVGDQ